VVDFDRSFLPAVNACLNSLAAVLLCLGWFSIKARKEGLHKALMISATVVSGLFLTSYLIHHGKFGSTRFTTEGWIRTAYYVILLTHVVLAAVNLPLILTTLYRAYKGDFARHAKIARWTLLSWIYVSVTGVLVYMLLYQIYPSADLGG
jgi:putative membrane protein